MSSVSVFVTRSFRRFLSPKFPVYRRLLLFLITIEINLPLMKGDRKEHKPSRSWKMSWTAKIVQPLCWLISVIGFYLFWVPNWHTLTRHLQLTLRGLLTYRNIKWTRSCHWIWELLVMNVLRDSLEGVFHFLWIISFMLVTLHIPNKLQERLTKKRRGTGLTGREGEG